MEMESERTPVFYLGVDLGQRVDYSAIVVVERPPGDALLVRDLVRVPLGTPYPRLVERVRELVNGPKLAGRCSVAVDGTGVGAPIVEMLRRAQLGCEMLAVTITGGERASSYAAMGGTAWSLPKQDLIAGMQVLLEQGQLKIAKDLKDVGALVRELMDVRSTTRVTGRVKLGADGSGEHDDLVIALGLACWSAGRKRNSVGNRRLV